MQKEQETLCLQILKFFTIWGEELHNLNKLNNNMKNNLSSIQKEQIVGVDIIYGQFNKYEQSFRTKDDRYLWYIFNPTMQFIIKSIFTCIP